MAIRQDPRTQNNQQFFSKTDNLITDVQFDDVQLKKFHDEVKKSIDSLGKTILNGVMINQSLTAGTVNSIPHGLGRKYNGFIVVKKFQFVDVYLVENTTLYKNDGKFIHLTPSVTANLSIWIF